MPSRRRPARPGPRARRSARRQPARVGAARLRLRQGRDRARAAERPPRGPGDARDPPHRRHAARRHRPARRGRRRDAAARRAPRARPGRLRGGAAGRASARRPAAAPRHVGHDRPAQARPAHAGELRRRRREHPREPRRPAPRRRDAPRRLADPRERDVRPPVLAPRRGLRGAARLRARGLPRGDPAPPRHAHERRPDDARRAPRRPGGRGRRPRLAPVRRLRRLADAAAAARARARRLGADLRPVLRPDRGAALPHGAPARGPRRRPARIVRPARRRLRAAPRSPGRNGTAGRDPRARAVHGRGLRRRRRALRADVRCGRLGADARRRPLRRARLPLPGRPHVRHDRDRRLQRVSARGRGRARRPSRRPGVRRRRRPGRALGRGGDRVRRPGRRRLGGGARRALPRPAGRVQGAEDRAFRRGDPEEPRRQAAPPRAPRSALGGGHVRPI